MVPIYTTAGCIEASKILNLKQGMTENAKTVTCPAKFHTQYPSIKVLMPKYFGHYALLV